MSTYMGKTRAMNVQRHPLQPDAEPMNPAFHSIKQEQAAAHRANDELVNEDAIQDEERENGAESAFKFGGQAGGTHSAPGPSASVIHAAKQAEAGHINGVALNGAIVPGDTPDSLVQHYNVSQAMDPHLQLM